MTEQQILSALNLKDEKVEKLKELRLWHLTSYNDNKIIEREVVPIEWNTCAEVLTLAFNGIMIKFVFDMFGKYDYHNIFIKRMG